MSAHVSEIALRLSMSQECSTSNPTSPVESLVAHDRPRGLGNFVGCPLCASVVCASSAGFWALVFLCVRCAVSRFRVLCAFTGVFVIWRGAAGAFSISHR